jgi:hypothetical protein
LSCGLPAALRVKTLNQIMKEFLTVEYLNVCFNQFKYWNFMIFWIYRYHNLKSYYFLLRFFFLFTNVCSLLLTLEFRSYLSCIAQKSNSTSLTTEFFFRFNQRKGLSIYWVWSNSTNSRTILYVCIGGMHDSIFWCMIQFFLMTNILCINI